jgi:hypothetical protein
MLNTAKEKMPLSDGIVALWLFLLLAVALCLPETRLWDFKTTPHLAPSKISCFYREATQKKQVVWHYDASDTADPLVGDVAKAGVKPLLGKPVSAIADAAAVTKGPTGQIHSVAFETKLNPTSYPGVSRGRHFQEANENLLRGMETDAGFAQMVQGSGINLQRSTTGLAPRTPPVGWTWHHASEAGVMHLVPRVQHAPGSIFQKTLHPSGQGGYSIWGQ